MQAIIHTIEPFDATIGSEIGFTWSGNQIYKARLLVKNNETGATAYDHTIDTMKTTYSIPANSGLVNGSYYVAYITVFDIDGNESDQQSIGTPFYCFSTPILSLSVSANEVIRSSHYNFTLSYSQTEGEELDYCNITLYSYQMTQLQASSTFYNITDASFTVTGLENMTQYYVRATGVTVHGKNLDTGYVLVTVNYETYKLFTNLELYNDKDTGRIGIRTNIVATEGHAQKDVTYIDGKYVDLTNNEVVYNIGYEVSGNFLQVFTLYNPNLNQVFARMQDADTDMTIDLIYREGSYADSNGRKCFIELRATSACDTYVLMGDYLTIPTDSQKIVIGVRRRDNLFQIDSFLMDKEV